MWLLFLPAYSLWQASLVSFCWFQVCLKSVFPVSFSFLYCTVLPVFVLLIFSSYGTVSFVLPLTMCRLNMFLVCFVHSIYICHLFICVYHFVIIGLLSPIDVSCINKQKFYLVLEKHKMTYLEMSFHHANKMASSGLWGNVVRCSITCPQWHWCIVVHLMFLFVLGFEFLGCWKELYPVYVTSYIFQCSCQG